MLVTKLVHLLNTIDFKEADLFFHQQLGSHDGKFLCFSIITFLHALSVVLNDVLHDNIDYLRLLRLLLVLHVG